MLEDYTLFFHAQAGANHGKPRFMQRDTLKRQQRAATCRNIFQKMFDVNLLEWNSERREAAVNEPLTLKTAKIKVPVLTLAFRAKHQMPAAFGELIVRHKLESNNQMREKLRGKANFVNEQT